MRQSPRLNSENKQLMDETLRQTVAIFPASEYCLPFIGVILYLKKNGAELIDMQSGFTIFNQPSKLEHLLAADPLRDAILCILSNVTSSVEETKLKHLLLPFVVEDFHASE